MKIGILKEIKPSENRVILIPREVELLIADGHEIFVENGAGAYSSFDDIEYEAAGANILPTSEKIFKNAELILKIQAPMPVEQELYEEHHISFSYLFLANNSKLVNSLLKYKSVYFAAELFTNNINCRPILRSQSKLAGKLAVLEGAKYLQKTYGGKGIMFGGDPPEIPNTQVTVIGAGTAGSAAARYASALGANVNLIDIDQNKLDEFDNPNPETDLIKFEYSPELLHEVLIETDVLITAVQVPGNKAPVLVTQKDLKLLKPGTVIVDLSIDQGGCVESSRPTTPDDPVFIQDNIVHFCVPNLPSVVPDTASQLISLAAFPYIRQIAKLGCQEVIALHPEIRNGLTLFHGKVVNQELAKLNHLEYFEVLEMLELSL
jgi:alanine dehydrogenase